MINHIEGTGSETLDETLKKLGYAYDAGQEIFYSVLDAWQRNFGYCRLYDEAAAPLSMIMDCEPIRFEYCGRRWLIQFWKGQYALTTGCELGVYWTDRPDIKIPGIFTGPFYRPVSDDELFQMSCTLYKGGEALFCRNDKHWWLTGFILGEFSEPRDLTMQLTITMKDIWMLEAFVNALKEKGYGEDEITFHGMQVSLLFDEPRTMQPLTRTPPTDWIIQRKNEMLCKIYRDITKDIDTIPGKFEAVRERAPRLYDRIMNMGKGAELFESYTAIQSHTV